MSFTCRLTIFELTLSEKQWWIRKQWWILCLRALILTWDGNCEKKTPINVVFLFCREINVTLPYETRNNGSLYVHMIVTPHGQGPFTSQRSMRTSSKITTYTYPKAETFNLMGDSADTEKVGTPCYCNVIWQLLHVIDFLNLLQHLMFIFFLWSVSLIQDHCGIMINIFSCVCALYNYCNQGVSAGNISLEYR